MREQQFPYLINPVSRGQRSFPGTLVTIALTALVTGGLVYAYEKQIQDRNTADLQRQITDLQQQVNDAKVVVAASPTPTATATPTITPTPSPTEVPVASWKTYRSTQLALSMKYPPEYASVTNLANTTITFGAKKIQVQRMSLRQGVTGEIPLISLTSTADAAILEYYGQDQALTPVIMDGVTYQKFVMDGIGTPTGYILQHNTKYYAFEFTFPPDDRVMVALLKSVKFE